MFLLSRLQISRNYKNENSRKRGSKAQTSAHTLVGRLPALGSVFLKIIPIGIYNFGNIFLHILSIDLGNKKIDFLDLIKQAFSLSVIISIQ